MVIESKVEEVRHRFVEDGFEVTLEGNPGDVLLPYRGKARLIALVPQSRWL
jgi:hypothetical protein